MENGMLAKHLAANLISSFDGTNSTFLDEAFGSWIKVAICL